MGPSFFTSSPLSPLMWSHAASAVVTISELVAYKHSLSSSTVAATCEQIMCVCCNSGLGLQDVHGMLCQCFMWWFVVLLSIPKPLISFMSDKELYISKLLECW